MGEAVGGRGSLWRFAVGQHSSGLFNLTFFFLIGDLNGDVGRLLIILGRI